MVVLRRLSAFLWAAELLAILSAFPQVAQKASREALSETVRVSISWVTSGPGPEKEGAR